jgi:hypothetical protein
MKRYPFDVAVYSAFWAAETCSAVLIGKTLHYTTSQNKVMLFLILFYNIQAEKSNKIRQGEDGWGELSCKERRSTYFTSSSPTMSWISARSGTKCRVF